MYNDNDDDDARLGALSALCRRCVSFYGPHKATKYVLRASVPSSSTNPPAAAEDERDAPVTIVRSARAFVEELNAGGEAETLPLHVLQQLVRGQMRAHGSGCTWSIALAGALAARLEDGKRTGRNWAALHSAARHAVRATRACAMQKSVDESVLATACAHSVREHTAAAAANAAVTLRRATSSAASASCIERRVSLARVVTSSVDVDITGGDTRGLLLPIARAASFGIHGSAAMRVAAVFSGANVSGALDVDVPSTTGGSDADAEGVGLVVLVAIDGHDNAMKNKRPHLEMDRDQLHDDIAGGAIRALAEELVERRGVRFAILHGDGVSSSSSLIDGFAAAGITCILHATRRNIESVSAIAGGFVPFDAESLAVTDTMTLRVSRSRVRARARWGWRSQRTSPRGVDDVGGGSHRDRDEPFTECGLLRITSESGTVAVDAGVVSAVLSAPSPRLLDAEYDSFVGCLRRCMNILNASSRDERAGTSGVLLGGGVWELFVANELDHIADCRSSTSSSSSTSRVVGGSTEEDESEKMEEENYYALIKTLMLRILADSLCDLVVLLLTNAGNDRKFPDSSSDESNPVTEKQDHKLGERSGASAYHGDSASLVYGLRKLLRDAQGDRIKEMDAAAIVCRSLLGAVDDSSSSTSNCTGVTPSSSHDDSASYRILESFPLYDDIETRVAGIRNAIDAVSTVACTKVVVVDSS